jgi:hypothetical protein
MLRLGEIIIFLCAVMIAASLGAVLYLLVGLNGPESITVAFAALTALAIYQAVTSRLHNRTDLGARLPTCRMAPPNSHAMWPRSAASCRAGEPWQQNRQRRRRKSTRRDEAVGRRAG